MIRTIEGMTRYFDKNGTEITEGSVIQFENGRKEKVYKTVNDELGTDATNPAWIEIGRAVECEYGIYPLTEEETNEVIVCKE